MDSEEKFEMILYRLAIILCIFILIMIVVGIDFYNDYQCSTTTDWEYWKSHNCIRYCKECKDENN